MAHVMILTASTGEGHNQAAATVARALEAEGHSTCTVDIFANANPAVGRIMNHGYHLFVTLAPRLYGAMYRLCDGALFPWFVGHVAHADTGFKLMKRIRAEKPALIVSTHPFAAPILGHFRASGRLRVPMVQIVTDFQAHFTYIQKSIDAFVVAGKATRRGMIRRGIDPARVHVYGIPVRPEFRTQAPLAETPRPGSTRILIMGGSMGLAPMEKAVHALSALAGGVHLTVVCGANKALKRRLDQSLLPEVQAGTVEILGYTREIPRLMAESHLVVTKPGGLTSSEAVSIGRPLIITFAIPGQESENRDLLIKEGLALAMDDPDRVVDTVSDLIRNPGQYQDMAGRMGAFKESWSTGALIGLINSLIH